MSVRRELRLCPKSGTTREFWFVDIDIQLPTGQRRRVRKVSPVQSRRGAEAYEREVRNALIAGQYLQEVKEAPLTFAKFSQEFMQTYAKTNNKPSEYHSKEVILRVHLVPNLGSVLIRDIDELEIERYKTKQSELGLSNKTINNHLAVLCIILRMAVEWKKLDKLPTVKRLKVQKPRFDFLTFEEVDTLLDAAQSEPFWQSMIIVAINTGLRLGELLALHWEDCDLANGTMLIRRSDWRGHVGSPKSGKERTVPLNAKALAAVRSQRHLRGPRVWCHSDGKPLAKDHMRAALKRIRKRSGLRHFDWHVLRHTFASLLAMRGVPLKAVQKLLGHSGLEMTLRYAHLSPDVRRDAVNTLQSYGNLTATRDSSLSLPLLVSA